MCVELIHMFRSEYDPHDKPSDHYAWVRALGAEGREGVAREWSFALRGDPWSGRVTLYYKNQPGERGASWVPEAEVAGRNWRLTMVQGDGAGGAWLPTRVNPFANAATADVRLSGRERLGLFYRESE